MPRSLLIVTVLLLALRVLLALHEGGPPPSLAWREAPAALEESARTGRPLLYDFSADWCRPCKRMDRELFADPETARFIESAFVPVRIEDGREGDGLSDAEAAALRARLGVESFPTLLVVREGRELARSSGYAGREQALEFLRAAVD